MSGSNGMRFKLEKDLDCIIDAKTGAVFGVARAGGEELVKMLNNLETDARMERKLREMAEKRTDDAVACAVFVSNDAERALRENGFL